MTIDVLPEARPLPPIGLAGAGADALDRGRLGRLASLRLGHLRVDLQPAGAGFRETLERATCQAREMGVGLECAIPKLIDAAEELAETAAACAQVRPPAIRWLVGRRDVEAARLALGPVTPGALFAAGSDANFTELNRDRPEPCSCDALWFALNPQVHARDDRSLVENLAGQAAAVESAHRFAGGKPVFATPVTLQPRFNAVATEAGGHAPPGDPRQRTVFGAAWTLGSIRMLAGSGAAGLTYYEIAGERGLFPPTFDVFASVGEFAGGEIVLSRSSQPLAVEALVLRKGARTRILLANFTGEPRQVRLPGRAIELKEAGVVSLELT